MGGPRHRHARAEPPQGPSDARSRSRAQPLRQPRPGFHLGRRRQALQCPEQAHHLVHRQTRRLLSRVGDPSLRRRPEVRLDGGEQRLVLRLAEAGGDPAPEDPPGRPDGGLLVVRHPLAEERERLLASPGIERRAESGPKREAAELEEEPLVVRAAPALLRTRPEDAPQIPVHRQRPAGAVPQRLLQVAPQVFDLAAGDRLRLLAEHDLQRLARRLDAARQSGDRAGRLVAAAGLLPELELQLPARLVG